MTNWYDSVPAPLDSNGDVVPLDTRALVLDGESRSVMCYIYGPTTRKWLVEFSGVDEQRHLNACTLPGSWEQLEKDAANDPCEYFGMDRTGSCDGCPAKSEDDKLFMRCRSVMTLDIVRRAKELAGVTDNE